jgi:hypothetical protein
MVDLGMNAQINPSVEYNRETEAIIVQTPLGKSTLIVTH